LNNSNLLHFEVKDEKEDLVLVNFYAR